MFYIQVVTLFAAQPLALSRGRAEWLRALCCEIACAHMNGIRVFVRLAAFVYMSTVCIVGGRGIAFTAHHLHFHTQFVMSVTRQGES